MLPNRNKLATTKPKQQFCCDPANGESLLYATQTTAPKSTAKENNAVACYNGRLASKPAVVDRQQAHR